VVFSIFNLLLDLLGVSFYLFMVCCNFMQILVIQGDETAYMICSNVPHYNFGDAPNFRTLVIVE